MENRTSVKTNIILNGILTISSFLFPLITFMYVSRILLPVGTGKVSLATSVITYFNIFAQLGIPTYGIRECAKVRDDREQLTRVAQELLVINLIMSAAAYLLLGIGIAVVPKLYEEKLLYIITSLTILFTAVGMEWLYRGLEQYKYITIRSLVFKVIAVIFMFLLIHKQEDYVIYGALSIFAASASNIMNFIHARKFISLKPVGHYQLKRHLRYVLVFFAMSCATTIYTNLDTVMLGFMKNDAEVGFYNAAVNIKVVLVGIVTSVGGVLLPRLSYYVTHDKKEEFRRLVGKAINFVFVLAAPLVIYFILFAKQSILVLSGSEYLNAVPAMRIIMPTLLIVGITNVLGIQILIPLGRERVVLKSEIFGAIADLILNMIFIPFMGAAGAALGTLIAEIVVMIVQLMALKQDVSYAFRSIQYYKIALAILIAAAVSCWALFLQIHSILVLLISAVLFFGIYGIVLITFRETLACDMFHQGLAWLKSHTAGQGGKHE